MKNPFIIFIFILTACTNNTISIENTKKGEMKSTYFLQELSQKNFPLDSETAHKPTYTQLYKDGSGKLIFSLLNEYNNSIYFYDYQNQNQIKKIHYDKEGPNGILKPVGYYIKNMDSIYVYDMMKFEIVLTDSSSICKQRIALKTTMDNKWSLYNPQYYFTTVNPILENNNNLYLTGYAPFSLPDKNLDSFCFLTTINLKTGEIKNQYKYPKELYGNNYNWEGGYFTLIYPCFSMDSVSICSFPISHNIYLYNKKNGKTKKIYAGSNNAGTIKSIDHEQRRTPNQLIEEKFLAQDLYGPILYDSYRNFYYRFMLNAMPGSTTNRNREDKELTIIIIDKNFNYLGEQIVGKLKRWNWENAFVSPEGLNIEYVNYEDIDETYLSYKTFIPKKITY